MHRAGIGIKSTDAHREFNSACVYSASSGYYRRPGQTHRRLQHIPTEQTSLRLARLIFSGFALFALVLERAKLRSSRLQDVAAVCGAAKLGAHVSKLS